MFHRSSRHSEETGMGNGDDFGFILGKRGNCWVIVRRVAARNDPVILNPASCSSCGWNHFCLEFHPKCLTTGLCHILSGLS